MKRRGGSCPLLALFFDLCLRVLELLRAHIISRASGIARSRSGFSRSSAIALRGDHLLRVAFLRPESHSLCLALSPINFRGNGQKEMLCALQQLGPRLCNLPVSTAAVSQRSGES